MSRAWFWPAALATLTLAVYARTAAFDFVSFDDNRYVTENAHVRGGLSWDGARWAFGSRDDNYWHPLAFLSHMADVSLAGVSPAWPHAENTLLHLANVLLLFFLLERMTGEAGPSAFVAAVFAIHPVQNETVAWIAERKSLLAVLFCLLSLRAYLARRRGAAAGCFALSLLAKPAHVGLPLVMLALDFWPLRRADGPRRLLAEKTPLFVLAALSSVMTRLTAVKVSAVPWPARLSNVAMSHLFYLRAAAWPAGLEAFYRYPDHPASAFVLAAVVIAVAGLTAFFWRGRSRCPARLVGWLWFLLFLEPSAGWVPIGAHARADRFLYMPLAGLAIALAWGLPGGLRRRRALPTLAAAWVLALTVVASVRLEDWRDSVSLFSRALAVDDRSALMQMHMGFALFEQRRIDEAIPHYQRALELEPNDAPTRNYLAIAYAAEGELADAATEFKRALALDASTPFARQNLAAVQKAAHDEVRRP